MTKMFITITASGGARGMRGGAVARGGHLQGRHFKPLQPNGKHMYTVSQSKLCHYSALDIAKAFDRVDHYALLKVLMDRHLSKNFIELLHDWLVKCYVCVRWGGAFSFWFGISAGVRQGGCLSPILIAVYMDIVMVCSLFRINCSQVMN